MTSLLTKLPPKYCDESNRTLLPGKWLQNRLFSANKFVNIIFWYVCCRKLIESGGLDFYNHEELCTGKCVSRNMSVHSNFARTSLNSNFNNASSSLMQESDIPQMDSNTNSLDERAYTVLKQVQDPNSETDMQEIDMDAVGSLALQKFTLLGTVKKEPKEVDEADLVPVETSSGQTMCISTANGVTTYIMSPSQQKRSKYDVLSAQGQSDFDNLAESFPNIEDFLDGECCGENLLASPFLEFCVP